MITYRFRSTEDRKNKDTILISANTCEHARMIARENNIPKGTWIYIPEGVYRTRILNGRRVNDKSQLLGTFSQDEIANLARCVGRHG